MAQRKKKKKVKSQFINLATAPVIFFVAKEIFRTVIAFFTFKFIGVWWEKRKRKSKTGIDPSAKD